MRTGGEGLSLTDPDAISLPNGAILATMAFRNGRGGAPSSAGTSFDGRKGRGSDLVRASVLGAGIAAAGLAAACGPTTDDLFGAVGGSGGGASAPASGSGATNASHASAQSTGVQSGSQSSGQPTTSVSVSSGGAACGNGVVDGAEACDGPDLGGHSCTDMGYSSPGSPSCDGACQVDYSSCVSTCGDGNPEPGEACDDGNAEPLDGCSSTCALQGDSCANPIALSLPLGSLVIDAETTGASHYESTGCQMATGPDLVYAVTPQQTGFLTVYTDPVATDFDAMLYVRIPADATGCETGDEALCGDNTPGQPDLVSVPVVSGVPVFLFVDGFDGAMGHVELHVDLSTGNDCSDPVPILAPTGGFAQHAIGSTELAGADAQSQNCGGTGADVVYQVTRLTSGNVHVANNAGYNSVTYGRSDCADQTSELACQNPAGSDDSQINLNDVGTTPVYVFIDGFNGAFGDYDVSFGP